MRKLIILISMIVLVSCGGGGGSKTVDLVFADGHKQTITCTRTYSLYYRDYAIQVLCDGNTYYVVAVEEQK